MLPNKGLYKDSQPLNQPQGTWAGARNLLYTRVKGAFTNEDGNKIHASNYPFATAEPIGTTPFPDGYYVVYSDGINGGKDRLGIVDTNNSYIDIIVDDILGFDKNYPIRKSEFDYNFLGNRIVAWTDRNKNPRILNLDVLPFALNPDKSLVSSTNITDLNLFPEFAQPFITADIIQGGSIKTGAYSVAIAYENNDGTRTPNTTPITVKYITDDPSSAGFDKFDGAVPGSLSNKALQYTITNVDIRYDKLILIIIAKINNQTFAYEVKKLDISSTSMVVTYLGTENVINLPLEEILTPRPLYTKTGTMTKVNNSLYHADLEQDEAIDYQSYANNIKIFYTSKLVSIKDINNSHKNNIEGSFPHGGVFGLYITFKLKNGSLSRSFHIPGRTVLAGDTDSSGVASGAGLTGKVYQVEDTTNKNSTSYFTITDGIHATSYAGGSNMGYWQNQDEVYPIGFPALAGQNVRHHVFPTIRKCKQQHYNAVSGYGRDQLDILSIDVANVLIPDSIKEKVEGWFISYAERGYENVNNFGTDLLLYASNPISNTSKIWSSGGNWYLSANTGGSDSWEDFDMRTDYLRGHNFELLRDKPQIPTDGLFMDLEIKLRKTGALSRFQDVGIQGGNISESGDIRGQNPGGILDLTDTVNTTASLPGSQLIRRISEFRYLPVNIIDGNFYTIKNEEAISMKIEGGSIAGFLESIVRANSSGVSSGHNFFATNGSFSTGGEETYLMTYKIIKSNLFANFTQQKLIATNKVITPNSTGIITVRGGDTFLSLRSFITTAPRHGADLGQYDQGISVIRAHIAESRYNIGLRYEVSGDVETKYYPKTNPTDFWRNLLTNDCEFIIDKDVNPNEVGYSDDYNTVNNYIQPIIFEPSQIITNKFPYRVIKSEFAGTNPSSLNSWKTYLSADFYESNRSRGKIENIQGMDDVLLIHHLYGIFYTLGTQRLALGATEVFLGTGDIFSQSAKEPVSTNLGFLGTQNIFSCVTFEGNYAWADQLQGRVFIISKGNGAVQISETGLYNYLRDSLKINNTLPNAPIVGECIIMGYDPLYNRLLLTRKSNINPFTLSYCVDDKFWISEHDYIPDIYFNTTNNFFCIKSGNLYQFNDSTSKGKYFGIIYPSYIDIIFNALSDVDKDFFNVNWITEIYKNNVLDVTKSLTHLTANTSYQSMARTALIYHTLFGVTANTRRKLDTWNFNKLKVADSDPFKRKPLIGKYCSIRYEYDNLPNLDLSQNLIYLYNLSCQARKATI